MNQDAREAVAALLWVVTVLIVGGGLATLLRPGTRRTRLARAALHFWAWGLGAAGGYAVDMAVAGRHRAVRDRFTGVWHEVHLDGGTALASGDPSAADTA